MDFRAQYLQAMRDQAPDLFKQLTKSGQLIEQASLKARQAGKMFRNLTRDAPRDKAGELSLQASREAEEQVKAALSEFEGPETTPEEDEANALQGSRPIVSPVFRKASQLECLVRLTIRSKGELIRRWFAKRPHWHVHFTPTSSSWINQVERFFALLSEQQIKRGAHRSVAELEDPIIAYIKSRNAAPKPFRWTKSADDILASIERFCRRTLDTQAKCA
jgi:hypothetical protein